MEDIARSSPILFDSEQSNIMPGLNLFQIPSLEHIAIVKIAVGLWNNLNIEEIIIPHIEIVHEKLSEDGFLLFLLLHEVRHKLKLLPLPEKLEKKISTVLEPIGNKLLSWFFTKEYLLRFDTFITNSSSLYWTMQGGINVKNTLETLLPVWNNHMDVVDGFKLASQYCMEESIPCLWAKIPAERRFSLNNRKNEDILSLYWAHHVEFKNSNILNELKLKMGEVLKVIISDSLYNKYFNQDHSIYIPLTMLSVSWDNLYALKYFWQNLRHDEIVYLVSDLTMLAVKNKRRYVLPFLLSQLDSKLQKKFFKEYCLEVLDSLIKWPLSKMIPDFLKILMEDDDEHVYFKLVWRLIDLNHIEMAEGLLKLNPAKVLLELNLKESFVNEILKFPNSMVFWLIVAEGHEGLLRKLFTSNELENTEQAFMLALRKIKDNLDNLYEPFILYLFKDDRKFTHFDLLFKVTGMDLDVTKRFKRHIALTYGHMFCKYYIMCNEWKMADLFLDWGFSSSQHDIEQLKRECSPTYVISKMLQLRRYTQMDQFLRWYFSNEDDIRKFKYQYALNLGCLRPLLWKKIFMDVNIWESYENFLHWCFPCKTLLENFKNKLSSFDKVKNYISGIIFGFPDYIKFAEKLLTWCFNSNEEQILKFKHAFLFSNEVLKRLNRPELIEDIKVVSNFFYPIRQTIIEFGTIYNERNENPSKLKSIEDLLRVLEMFPAHPPLKNVVKQIPQSDKDACVDSSSEEETKNYEED